MKKVKMFLVFLLAITLTGCVKYSATMEVKDDKSVSLEIIYGMEISDDILDGNSGEEDSADDENDSVNVEDYKYLEELGYKVEEFKETKDGSVLSGVKIIKTFDNIDDIVSSSKITVNFIEIFSEENKDKLKDVKFFYKDGNNYVANFVFDFLEGADEEERKDMVSYDAYINDLSYSIKLPTKVGENNASKVSDDGKELTWNLTYSKVNEVNFSFALKDNFLPIIVGVVVGMVIVAVIVVIVVLNKKKKNSNLIDSQPLNQDMNFCPTQPVNNINQSVDFQQVSDFQSIPINDVQNNDIQ